MKCLQIKKPQDEKWTLLAQNIENFKYENGYTYVVRVKVDDVKNPPADGSSFKYSLKKILNRERTGGKVVLENSTEESGVAVREPRNGSELVGKNWQLTAIDGSIVNTDKATLIFNLDNNRIGGNGGCNSFGGNMAATSDKIRIWQVFSTKMFCENGSDVENKYLAALEKVNKYRVSDGKLQLLSGETILLEFAPKN